MDLLLCGKKAEKLAYLGRDATSFDNRTDWVDRTVSSIAGRGVQSPRLERLLSDDSEGDVRMVYRNDWHVFNSGGITFSWGEQVDSFGSKILYISRSGDEHEEDADAEKDAADAEGQMRRW